MPHHGLPAEAASSSRFHPNACAFVLVSRQHPRETADRAVKSGSGGLITWPLITGCSWQRSCQGHCTISCVRPNVQLTSAIPSSRAEAIRQGCQPEGFGWVSESLTPEAASHMLRTCAFFWGKSIDFVQRLEEIFESRRFKTTDTGVSFIEKES